MKVLVPSVSNDNFECGSLVVIENNTYLVAVVNGLYYLINTEGCSSYSGKYFNLKDLEESIISKYTVYSVLKYKLQLIKI